MLRPISTTAFLLPHCIWFESSLCCLYTPGFGATHWGARLIYHKPLTHSHQKPVHRSSGMGRMDLSPLHARVRSWFDVRIPCRQGESMSGRESMSAVVLLDPEDTVFTLFLPQALALTVFVPLPLRWPQALGKVWYGWPTWGWALHRLLLSHFDQLWVSA